MGSVFISYRREDSEGQAGRLFRDLVAHFGEDSVFMDVKGIDAGRDFRRAIDEQVSTCDVLLAIIGRSWTEAKDESGRRRLEDPEDFVRLETSTALKRDIPVIPVLVGGTRMPRKEQLPKDLEALAYRNGVELTHARWDSDVQVLIKSLGRYIVSQHPDGHQTNDTLSTKTPHKMDTAGAAQKSTTVTVGEISSGTTRLPNKTTGLIIAGLVAIISATVFGGYAWYSNPTQPEGVRTNFAKDKEKRDRAADDAAWTLAETTGTREAVQEYLKKTELGGIPGLHLNDARQMLADLKRGANEAAAKAEQDRIAKAEQDRRAKAEQDRLAKAEQDRIAKAEQDRRAKAEQDRIAKAEQDRIAREQQDRAKKVAQERPTPKGSTEWWRQ